MAIGPLTAKGTPRKRPSRVNQGAVTEERVDRRIGSFNRRIRWSSDVGMELQCTRCLDFWPTLEEFWYPRQGLSVCHACRKEIIRTKQAKARSVESVRAEHRDRLRAERQARRRAA